MRTQSRVEAVSVLIPTRAWLGLVSACLFAFASAASAAPPEGQIYKSVGAGGVTSYSDSAGASGASNATPLGPQPADSGNPPLPYALQQVAQRYPVSLYVTTACTACDAARAFLVTRGIPFDEKSITTPADDAALQQRTGAHDLPVLAMGTKYLTGFTQTTWVTYLDAAGYPRISQLPIGWRAPPAAPLVPESVATPPTTREAPTDHEPAASLSPPPAPSPATGKSAIRF